MSEQDPTMDVTTAPKRCSICGTLIRAAEAVKACPDCRQDYHQTCWDDIDGCATYGCKSAAVAEKPPPPEVVHGGWGDEKECPACQASIASSLLVCLCGARFPWADPMSPEDYTAWLAQERSIAAAQKALIVLFLLSIAGAGAPLCGPIAAIYAHRNRRRLAGAHGVYLAMGYGSAALGVAYVGAALVLAFAW